MKIVIITDLHLGKQNKTTRLIANLMEFLQTNKSIAKEIDMFVITGDVFDKLLATNSEAYNQITMFFTYLVGYCKHYNIILRTLEGTPSHDNRQMVPVANTIKGLLVDIDYRHMDTLEIEYMSKYNKHMLYLPDKYKDSGEEIQDAMSDLLLEHGLNKVDMIFAHGNFNYQLPIKLKSGLDEDFFISICRFYIIIGHIHNRSIWKTIIAPGSFDRLEVNQEIDKGGVFLSLGKDINSSTFKFLPNLVAMKVDTVDVRGMDNKQSYRLLNAHIRTNSLEQDDHLRIRTDTLIQFKELKERLVGDGNKLKIERFTESTIVNKTVQEVKAHSITINEGNIYELLLSRNNIEKLSNTKKDRIKYLIKSM